ncbi:universal stress protein [Tenuifilum thalassicum]|uniref:Universal stress protein n=1 Tax=Tenuifilum thalassicum TaxID=2590900 RepID=A0A7D3Y607_9BACT|nr:universal stress protein [Tenuifilum thalassicum]QKG81049.1 universal stress protein [Tenuifilum thalassicum]
MMENLKKVILVPWDFTEGAEIAFLHALQLAKASGNEIMLLHIIPHTRLYDTLIKKVNLKKIEQLNLKIEESARKLEEKHGFKLQTLVVEGHPARIIKGLIITAHVNLIVSYYEYKTGKKQLRISKYLRNLFFKDTTLPFIIVSKPPLHSHYIEIVVPVDYDRKFKEAVHWIIYLAKYYKCNINLIKPFLSDDSKKKQLANNIYFTKKMLDGVNIVYGIKTAKKRGTFDQEVFRFAKTIEADLILIMSDKYNVFLDSKTESNLDIPVMCINPRIRKYQSFY